MLVNDVRSLPPQLSIIETLVAFADDQVSRSLYNNAARHITAQSDLFIKLALHKKFKGFEAQQCFVIEAASRGLIDKKILSALYDAQSFNADDLNGTNQAVKMHPCKVPAFFYHRIQNGTPTKENINALLDSSASIPPHALTPFAAHLVNFDYDEQYLWRAGIIMALSGTQIPDHELLAPLNALQDSNQLNTKQAKKWLNAVKKSKLYINLGIDPALPIHYLRSLSGVFSNLEGKKDKFNYENFFSLTYGEKSLHSGLGKFDAMFVALRNKDVVRLFMIALSQSGNHKPNEIAPDGITGILSSLSEYKLKKEKDMLAIDALHR